MTLYSVQVLPEVLEEVAMILGTLPGKVFYSKDGEALILADEGKYIIRVIPPSVILPGFNPATESAYLVTNPAANLAFRMPGDLDVSDDLEGWSTGWEC